MRALTRKALTDITRRPGRTVLAILGIFIGILGLTAVNEANSLISAGFFYSTDAQGSQNVTFTVHDIPSSVSTSIRHLPSIQDFQQRTTYNTLWMNAVAGNTLPVIEINSYHVPLPTPLGAFELTAGHLPGNGEMVMDNSDQAIKPTAIGDTVTVATPDGHTVPIRVVGFVRTRGLALWHPPADAIAYMSAAALQHIFPPSTKDSYTLPAHLMLLNHLPRGAQILIKTRDANNAQQTNNSTTQILDRAQLTTLFSYWRASASDADTQLTVLGLLAIIQLLTLVTLLLICVMIFNSVSALITEQIRFIGTMKALGGTRILIVRSYLLTVFIYGVIGTILGLGLGLVAGYQLASRLTATVNIQVGQTLVPLDVGPFQIAPWVLVTSACVGLLVPLLSALWPLWVGTRITVREAIAAYGVQPGNTRQASAWGRQLRWVPQTVWLGLRGLFRKPGRVGSTLLALSISAAVFLAIQISNDSLNAYIAQGATPFHSDARIDLTNTGTAHSQPAITALQALPNVKQVEPIDPVVISINQKEIRLMGLLAHTRLYTPQVVVGSWLRTPGLNELVINDFAAQRLSLHVGDKVTVHTNATDTNQALQANWTIIGVVHDTDEVSGSANPAGRQGWAFTTLTNLNLTLRHQDADMAERIWLQASDHSPQALRVLGTRVQAALSHYDGAYYQPWEQVHTAETGSFAIVYLLFSLAALLVAVIGLLSLTHTLAASVLERRLEIGILRSLGATSWRVGIIFFIEALALAMIAWGIGIVLGIPGTSAILNVFSIYFGPVDMSLQPLAILITFLLVIVVVILASFGPSLSASHVRIRGILRYE